MFVFHRIKDNSANFANNRGIRAVCIGTPNVEPLHAVRKETVDTFNLHSEIQEFRKDSSE